MRGVMSLPLWAIALVLAAIAPFFAKGLASMFELRARKESERLLSEAESTREGGGGRGTR
jgi:hypothetical protein